MIIFFWLISFIFSKSYYFYNPFVGGFLSNNNKRGSYENHFYSVTPQVPYITERVGDKYLLKMKNGTLDRNRSTNKPIGWNVHKQGNQLYSIDDNKIMTEGYCLKGGLNSPYFSKCNGEKDEEWIKIDSDLANKINKKIGEIDF